jgi:hypothetical protein
MPVIKIQEQARKLSQQQQEIKELREQRAEMRRLVERATKRTE